MKQNIKVQANSKKQVIQTDIDGKIQKVFLKKSAKNNKANNELEKFLSKHFKTKVKIIKANNPKIPDNMAKIEPDTRPLSDIRPISPIMGIKNINGSGSTSGA